MSIVGLLHGKESMRQRLTARIAELEKKLEFMSAIIDADQALQAGLQADIEELEAENKMLRKLAQAEAMAAVRTEHDLVHILISACKKTEIGREALREWDLARTAKGE